MGRAPPRWWTTGRARTSLRFLLLQALQAAAAPPPPPTTTPRRVVVPFPAPFPPSSAGSIPDFAFALGQAPRLGGPEEDVGAEGCDGVVRLRTRVPPYPEGGRGGAGGVVLCQGRAPKKGKGNCEKLRIVLAGKR